MTNSASPELSEERRISREKHTVSLMISMYCRSHHDSANLCADCAELHAYAMCRLDRCPYGEKKPRCTDCPIHCYNSDMRERIKEVMRYSGPRMLFKHPVLALLHELPAWRKLAAVKLH